jgi:hypothetical protein
MDERVAWLRWSLRGFLALAVANLFMTGSRGPVMLVAAAAPTLIILAARSGRGPVVRLALTLAVSLPVIVLLVNGVFPDAGTAFVERASEGGDIGERALGTLGGPLLAVGRAGAMGYGIGSTHQAASFLVPAGAMPALDVEGEWERIILELGPIGFLFVLLARILVVRRLWTALTGQQDEGVRPYLAGALVFCLMAVPGDVVFTHTAAVFYWFIAGFALVPATKAASEPRRPVERAERGGPRRPPARRLLPAD